MEKHSRSIPALLIVFRFSVFEFDRKRKPCYCVRACRVHAIERPLRRYTVEAAVVFRVIPKPLGLFAPYANRCHCLDSSVAAIRRDL